MEKISGNYTSAEIFAGDMEEYAAAQIRMICDQQAAAHSKIRIMPDVHPGKVGPVGLTMTVRNAILPALLGADLGCGIRYMKIAERRVEFQKLDRVIRENIPSGFKVRTDPHRYSEDFAFHTLICRRHINEEKARLSLGTLGGGNHFIELDQDEEGNLYAFVHSGSRHLGAEVSAFYLKEGQRKLKKKGIHLPYELTYLDGELLEDYLHDVFCLTGFAMLNRELILHDIAKKMKWKEEAFGESIHNYVDERGILRKGAISAYLGDEVIIPINMRDGILLGIGKGNSDWNYSAPHGAGRIMTRKAVLEQHTAAEFRRQMQGIYSTSISKDTLDEAPFAYRGMNEILAQISPSVEVTRKLRPVYNFKAGRSDRG